MDDVLISAKTNVDTTFETEVLETGESLGSAILFEGPAWEKGLLDVNVSALTEAIQELARRLTKEVSERKIITSRLEVLDETLASLLASQGDEPKKEGMPTVEESNEHSLEDMRKRLVNQNEYQSRQLALQRQSFEASFELRMDAFRRDVASSLRRAELDLAAHSEAILVQTKDLAAKEADLSAKACLAEEASGLHGHVTKLGDLLAERLKLLEDQLRALNLSVEGVATSCEEAKATSATALETASGALSVAEKCRQNQAVAAEQVQDRAQSPAQVTDITDAKFSEQIELSGSEGPGGDRASSTTDQTIDDAAMDSREILNDQEKLQDLPKDALMKSAQVSSGADPKRQVRRALTLLERSNIHNQKVPFTTEDPAHLKQPDASYATVLWVESKLAELQSSIGATAFQQASFDVHGKLLLVLEQRVEQLEAAAAAAPAAVARVEALAADAETPVQVMKQNTKPSLGRGQSSRLSRGPSKPPSPVLPQTSVSAVTLSKEEEMPVSAAPASVPGTNIDAFSLWEELKFWEASTTENLYASLEERLQLLALQALKGQESSQHFFSSSLDVDHLSEELLLRLQVSLQPWLEGQVSQLILASHVGNNSEVQAPMSAFATSVDSTCLKAKDSEGPASVLVATSGNRLGSNNRSQGSTTKHPLSETQPSRPITDADHTQATTGKVALGLQGGIQGGLGTMSKCDAEMMTRRIRQDLRQELQAWLFHQLEKRGANEQQNSGDYALGIEALFVRLEALEARLGALGDDLENAAKLASRASEEIVLSARAVEPTRQQSAELPVRLSSNFAALQLSLRDEQHRLQDRLAVLELQIDGLRTEFNESCTTRRSNSKRQEAAVAAIAGSDVEHLANALRGVQRDTSLTKARLEDVTAELANLKTKVDIALPQILNALLELLAATGERGEDGGTGGGHITGNAEEANFTDRYAKLRELLLGSLASGVSASDRRFVSEGRLNDAMEASRVEHEEKIASLRQELLRLLSNKADNEELRALIDRFGNLAEFVQDFAHRSNLMLTSQHEESVDNAAIFRLPLLPGHCISCNRRVDLAVDRRSSWERRESQGSPWPVRLRAPSQQGSRMGRDRDYSLPSIGRELSPANLTH